MSTHHLAIIQLLNAAAVSIKLTLKNHPTREHRMPDSTSQLSPEALAFWKYFESAGAQLTRNEQFSSLYRIDFSIVGLQNLFAHVNLGVHVTTQIDNLNSMQCFINGANRGICVKALYIELDPSTIDTGAQITAFGAALNFLFEKSREKERCIGLRIFQDCTLQYFQLDTNIEKLSRIHLNSDLVIGDCFKGRVTHYFTERGFGFIQTPSDRKFFLHIANIADDRLRTQLAAYKLGQLIPVEFQFGGSDGGKYPKAINVVLDDTQDPNSYPSVPQL